MKKVQSLAIETTIARETTSIVLSEVDGLNLEFRLLPYTDVLCVPKVIPVSTTATAEEFKTALNTFYLQGCYGS